MRFLKFYKEYIAPPGLMAAMIIGAGMFALPFVFAQSGIVLGFIYLALFGVVLSSLHLMYAEIMEATPGEHRFMGYSTIHLKSAGFYTSFITTFLGILLTFLIYIVVGSAFVRALWPGVSELESALIFWMAASVPALMGIKKITDINLVATILMMFGILMLFALGTPKFSWNELRNFNLKDVYLPYAAVLFSLYGRSAISSIMSYLKKERVLTKARLNYAVVLGTVIPAVLYAFFALGVIGLSLGDPSVDSITSLARGGDGLSVLTIAVLGLLSLWTSYVMLGQEFMGIAKSDLKLGKSATYAATFILPVLLYIVGLKDMLQLIGIAGGVFIAVESILVVIMWSKIKKPRVLTKLSAYAIIIIFIAGALKEISNLF